MLRLKSLEGSDNTALALLSNDINTCAALCRECLENRCCAAASVLYAADEAVATVATHHDRVMFCSLPAQAAADAAAQSLLQLQRCVDDSEGLRSQGGAITRAAVDECISSCRCVAHACTAIACSFGPCFPANFSRF